MRLPHVTIEYREEESYAIGKMSPELIVGFGLHWAWMYLAMYNGITLFGAGGGTYRTLVFIISLAVFVATLLGYGLLINQARSLFNTAKKRKRNRVIAAVCMVAGTALFAPAFGDGAVGVAASFTGGVLSGFGSAVIFMSFGVSFSVCDVAESSISAAFALMVGACVYALVSMLNAVMPPAAMAVCLALPLAELWCLGRCSAKLIDNLEFGMLTIPVRKGAFFARLGVPCLVMGLALGVVRGWALSAAARPAAGNDLGLVIVLAGAATCATMVASMLMQRQTAYYIFRTLLPVVALLMGALVTPLGDNPTFFVFAVFAVYLMLEACMWLPLADISQRYRISAFTVFGFGRGALAAGTLIVVLAEGPHMAEGVPLPDGTSALVVAVLVLITVGRSLMPTSTELRAMMDRCGSCPAFAGTDDMSEEAQAIEAEVQAPLTQSIMRAALNGNAPERAESGNKMPHAPGAGNADGAEGGAAPHSNSEASSTAAAPSAQEDRVREGVAASVASDDAGDFAPERMGKFKRKCLVIADTYLLSRKETEVLFLLAKGRNSSAIQKSLYISAGTANTHMRNIYRKLNVHSQQELIALVESVE